MLFQNMIVALFVAVTAVAAIPTPAESVEVSMLARAAPKAQGKNFKGAKLGGKTKTAASGKAKAAAAKAAAAKAAAAKAAAAKAASAKASGKGSNSTAAASAATQTLDSGTADVISVCPNKDGVTGCELILVNVANGCFDLPNPVAGDVAFLAPPPNSTCNLFTAIGCTSSPLLSSGVVKNTNQNSIACNTTLVVAAVA